MPADGTVRFAEDIYGHDAKLKKALADQTLRGAVGMPIFIDASRGTR